MKVHDFYSIPVGFPLKTSGDQQFPLNSHWKSMKIHDCHWFVIGNQWISVISIEFPLQNNGDPWFPLNFHWKSMKVRGFYWIRTGNQWNSMLFIDLSMKIIENPWFSLTFHWKSMKIVESACNIVNRRGNSDQLPTGEGNPRLNRLEYMFNNRLEYMLKITGILTW